jgi:hypothetical protein
MMTSTAIFTDRHSLSVYVVDAPVGCHLLDLDGVVEEDRVQAVELVESHWVSSQRLFLWICLFDGMRPLDERSKGRRPGLEG